MKLKLTTLAAALALGMTTGAGAGVLSKDELKREADYKAARERCDSLAGTAKNYCINQAKTAHGM